MISYAWSREVPAELVDDLDELVAEAVEYDAEAGFSTADPHAPAPAGVDLHHLLVRMPPKGSRGSAHLDRLPDVKVVAYLRLEVAGGVGEASLVVREEFRSLGVATLMMERMLEEPEGWAAIDGLRELKAWSHSAHPAAERMSWRFGADVEREIFKTLRLIGGREPYEAEAPPEAGRGAIAGLDELAPGHARGIAPADQAARDRADALIRIGGHAVAVGRGVEGSFEAPAIVEPVWSGDPTEDQVRAVLDAGLLQAQSTGARVASLYVDAQDELVLHVSRHIEFFHDQTDRRYALTLPA